MTTEPVGYVDLDGAQIAYQVIGDGPVDFVYMLGIGTNFQSWWDYRPFAEVLNRLCSFSRLILFDRRGSGISDDLVHGGLSTWEAYTEDLKTVLDAVRSDQALLMASFDAGPVALTFAATYPDRINGLVLWNSYARFMRDDDYPFGMSRQEVEASNEFMKTMWGTEELARYLWVDADSEYLRWVTKVMRGACTPASYARQNAFMTGADARGALPLIQAPVLTFSTKGFSAIPPELGQYVAEHVQVGEHVALEGREQDLFTRADRLKILDRLQEFVTGTHPRRSNRILAGVLFTDIVASTELAAELGDDHWRLLLESHDRTARSVIESWKGRLIKSTGDGVLATFDGPGRTLQAALEVRSHLDALGINIRAGAHFGEVELRDDGDIGGLGVHLAARTMSVARDGELYCTRTMKELALGSGLSFEDRGVHALKGIPESWQLYAVRMQ